jgi:hypothetical protein
LISQKPGTTDSIQKEIYSAACEHVSIAVPCVMTCAVLIITLIRNSTNGCFVYKKLGEDSAFEIA